MTEELNLKEYVVTLKNFEDLKDFYNDMETEGGDLYIPNRVVSVQQRRPMSRNTNYLLSNTEAETLMNDPRVLEVMPKEIIVNSIRPAWIDTSSNWYRRSNNIASDKNWGLLRCTETDNRSNWGRDGTTSVTGTAITNTSGRNVDVILIDGHINPDHPEYAVNPDGTGGSRVNQFNWYTLNNIVSSIDDDDTVLLSSDYVYTPYTGTDAESDNNHGAHVAGTVAGNSQGWARDANIYNINPYASNPNGENSLIMWDYIRAFHRTKPINPATGKRNPTICNGSYTGLIQFPNTEGYTSGSVTRVTYRGNTVGDGVTALTPQQLTDAGIYNDNTGTVVVPFYSAAVEADIADAIADGIIVVGAASNDSFLIDREGGLDYDNNFRASYFGTNFNWYYHRGSAPGAAANVICVGAVDDLVGETKATFSNCGPRVDVYAPGRYIMSSLNSGTVNDLRNSAYKVTKYSGTSMASPQVCGVLACLLETYPNLTQAEAQEWIRTYGSLNKITDTGGGTNDLTSLQGSDNRFLYARKERQDTGTAFPKLDYKPRPTSGTVYPRTRINRTP
jgi:hypothetical protein